MSELIDAVISNNIDQVGEFIPIYTSDPDNLDDQDDNGNTALLHAINNENTDIVELLLDNGADPTIQNNNGETALIMAITIPPPRGAGIIDLLLDNEEMMPDDQFDNGETALMIASNYGHTDIVKLLIQYGMAIV